MALALDSWTFVLDTAESLSLKSTKDAWNQGSSEQAHDWHSAPTPLAQRSKLEKGPKDEQALVLCVYQFIRNKLPSCTQRVLDQELTAPMETLQSGGSPRLAILISLWRLYPQQFASDYDVRTVLRIDKASRALTARRLQPSAGVFGYGNMDARRTNPSACDESARVLWQYARDSFAPVAFFHRTFVDAVALAGLEKTKSKADWEVLVTAVDFVTAELLVDVRIAQRFSTILCAVWSNHAVWARLCADFFVKLAAATLRWCLEHSALNPNAIVSHRQAPPPGEVLVMFSLKCPHEHFVPLPRKDWISGLLSRVQGAIDKTTLCLLWETHGGNSAEDLVQLIHASMPSSSSSASVVIDDKTETLLFRKLLPQQCLAADDSKGPTWQQQPQARSLLDQVRLLMRCKFKALRSDAGRDACDDDWGSAEFWEELYALEESGQEVAPVDVDSYDVVSEWDGALETQEIAEAERDARTRVTYDIANSVYRRFGEAGERLVVAFLETATPSQLAVLFQEFGSRVAGEFLCGGPDDLLVKKWRPAACAVSEAGDLVEVLVEHVPHLWSRCAWLVWNNADLEVTADNTKLVTRLLFGRAPRLDLIPPRWWHCVHFSKLAQHCLHTLHEEGDIERLVRAGVPVPLQDVRLVLHDGALSLAGQELLLDKCASEDCCALAECIPLFLGPIAGYLERFFALLDGDAATYTHLVRTGDGVSEQEKYSSGWNKVVNILLTGLRVRVRDGVETTSGRCGRTGLEVNWLHSEEQLVLFKNCCSKTSPVPLLSLSPDGAHDTSAADAGAGAEAGTGAAACTLILNNTNAAVLADLLEDKCVDPNHIARVVNLVLSAPCHRQVRDSALRAMVRLTPNDRNQLIAKLLSTPHKLPMQVIHCTIVLVLFKFPPLCFHHLLVLLVICYYRDSEEGWGRRGGSEEHRVRHRVCTPTPSLPPSLPLSILI